MASGEAMQEKSLRRPAATAAHDLLSAIAEQNNLEPKAIVYPRSTKPVAPR